MVDLERVEPERDQPPHELLEPALAVEPDRERRMREARDAARRMHERDRLARGEPRRRDVRGPARAQETREGFVVVRAVTRLDERARHVRASDRARARDLAHALAIELDALRSQRVERAIGPLLASDAQLLERLEEWARLGVHSQAEHVTLATPRVLAHRELDSAQHLDTERAAALARLGDAIERVVIGERERANAMALRLVEQRRR